MLESSARCISLLFVVAVALVGTAEGQGENEKTTSRAEFDEHDWPMYNRDVRGTRHNPAESTLNRKNVARLVEKWRFPAKDSDGEIGVIHATPTVVDGSVYFGTMTDAAFYRVSPDGKLVWRYRNPAADVVLAYELKEKAGDPKLRALSQAGGILASAVVTHDTVYFGDTAGCFIALDRETGRERWKLNARAPDFPDAHWFNVFIASPILADGKVIVGGGTLEQLIAGSEGYKGSTGRGFVIALHPRTGRLIWKYDVGPKPQELDPPVTIEDDRGKHTWTHGPATSSVWSTPSFDSDSATIFFGTDVNTAPRRPTKEDPRYETDDSCAVVAVDVKTGKKKWSTQLNPGDMWTNSMRGYDPKTGRYKDQSVGDTPKVYDIVVAGKRRRVVGVGCKNGGYYVLDGSDGRILQQTPVYAGPPAEPLKPAPHPRTLALPGVIGGLQTGCATDGERVYTNGIDAIRVWTLPAGAPVYPPSGGRVVAISPDTKKEYWRHERPKILSIGGPAPIPVWKNVGDPMASGLAIAGGLVYCTTASSGKLLVLDKKTGKLLKEVDIGPVFCGPSVSRGRVYVGTGNTLFSPMPEESYFPKKFTGELICFGVR